jgi:hypothetical protein
MRLQSYKRGTTKTVRGSTSATVLVKPLTTGIAEIHFRAPRAAGEATAPRRAKKKARGTQADARGKEAAAGRGARETQAAARGKETATGGAAPRRARKIQAASSGKKAAAGGEAEGEARKENATRRETQATGGEAVQDTGREEAANGTEEQAATATDDAATAKAGRTAAGTGTTQKRGTKKQRANASTEPKKQMAAKKAPKERRVFVAHVGHHWADAARFHEHKKSRNTARQISKLRMCNIVDAIRRKIIQRISAHPQRLHQGQRQRPQHCRGHPKSNPSGGPKQERKQDHSQHFKQDRGPWAALSML